MLNFAHARRISSGFRGRSMFVPARPGTISGASQNAFHFSRSITSGVSATPSSFSGAICCSERRRTPLVIWNSGERFRPRVIQPPAALRAGKFTDQRLASRNVKLARSCSRRSPCQFTSSTPARIPASSPSCALYALRSQEMA